jgi:anti-sigma factor RsiW
MCDKELLVEYLYDEIGADDRRAVEAHLAECGECRAEAKGLRATRTQLAEWAPPRPELAFQVVRGAALPVARRRFWQPAWGLAAAAVLVHAAAASLANLEVKYGPDGLTVRTGWGRVPPAAAPAAVSPVATAASHASDQDLRQQLQQIADRQPQLETVPGVRPDAVPVRAGTAPAVSNADTLRQVRRIVADSEERQQQQLAMRVGQVNRDVDLKLRRYAEFFQRGLQQVQGLTDTTILRQREMENHLSRVVLQQPK